jgi:hypothetical protein
METLGNKQTRYYVKNSQQAKRLETAVKNFNLKYEIGSFSKSFNPPVYIKEISNQIVFIQPMQGSFSKLEFGEGIVLVNPKLYLNKCSSEKRLVLFISNVNYIAFKGNREYWISESPRE